MIYQIVDEFNNPVFDRTFNSIDQAVEFIKTLPKITKLIKVVECQDSAFV